MTDWRPSGIDDLEPAAWDALRDPGSTAVIAGPGGGKTEFLAQRAAYLLQTGLCAAPQRILAISFKRDAAANLGRRVRERAPEHANRFLSMTFDAFTKGMVDRFTRVLPAAWRMKDGYELVFPSTSQTRTLISEALATLDASQRQALRRVPSNRFAADVVGAWSLPVDFEAIDPTDPFAAAARAWWQHRYLRPGTANVDFVMLNRLAELMVRASPQLRRALRVTYPFVFVDEFQDTTGAQLSFLRSVFGDGPIVTAVGDGKQRIMGWAGALHTAMDVFAREFAARRYPLEWNFRSSAPLVQLQHVIARRLDQGSVPAVSMTGDIWGGDEFAELWRFSGPEREAVFIAQWIANDVRESGRTPADYALIVRQKVADFEPRLAAELRQHGLKVRNDDALVGKMRLQDLLKNDVARLVLGMLRLADQPRGLAPVWREVSAIMSRLHGVVGDDTAERHVGEKTSEQIAVLGEWLRRRSPGTALAVELVQLVLDTVDVVALGRFLKSEAHHDDLQIVADAIAARFAAVQEATSTWAEVFDQFECTDAVALLTAHRSKGLEYHTVLFLGLDDQQWWAHSQDPDESTSTFFVGLSRAARRLIFTTTAANPRSGRIAEFFAMLDSAGVSEVIHD